VLTKPIGTGVLTTALKRDVLQAADLAPAVTVMTTLNAGAMRAMTATGVHAATDVTGFGLLGHLRSLLEASGVAAEVDAAAVPLLPLAREAAERNAIPGGSQRNLDSLGDHVEFAAAVDPILRQLLADAQTSGGLLIALPAARRAALGAALAAQHTPAVSGAG
jgi:selenide,water dikinase